MVLLLFFNYTYSRGFSFFSPLLGLCFRFGSLSASYSLHHCEAPFSAHNGYVHDQGFHSTEERRRIGETPDPCAYGIHLNPRQRLLLPSSCCFLLPFFFVSFHISFVMRWFRDASIVPDFGKEEIPIIAMTHMTAGREKNGMKEKQEGRRRDIFIGPVTTHTGGSGGDTYKGRLRGVVIYGKHGIFGFFFSCFSCLLFHLIFFLFCCCSFLCLGFFFCHGS